MRVIVTGGAGFIGSNLVHHLSRDGFTDVIVVDDFQNAEKFMNLRCAGVSDLVDRTEFLTRLDDFDDCDIVFHLGACSSTTESDGSYLLANNIDYSKKILAWAQTHSVRMVYASSASVYGTGEHGFDDADPRSEYPLNGYAFSKWAFDGYVRRLLARGNLEHQVVALRYFNVYGPQEWHKGGMCSPMLHFHRQVSDSRSLKLFEGSDNYLRDFVSVQDCCAVNAFFLNHPEISGIYNCGTGEPRSFRDVATLLVSHYPGATIEEVPFPDHLRGKYQVYTCADLRRLRAAGYEAAFTPLDVGLASYVRSLQSTGGYLEP